MYNLFMLLCLCSNPYIFLLHCWEISDFSQHSQEYGLWFLSLRLRSVFLRSLPLVFETQISHNCPRYFYFYLIFFLQFCVLSDFIGFKGKATDLKAEEDACCRESIHTLSETLPLASQAQAKDHRTFCIGKMFLSFCSPIVRYSHSVVIGQWKPINMHLFTAQTFSD